MLGTNFVSQVLKRWTKLSTFRIRFQGQTLKKEGWIIISSYFISVYSTYYTIGFPFIYIACSYVALRALSTLSTVISNVTLTV